MEHLLKCAISNPTAQSLLLTPNKLPRDVKQTRGCTLFWKPSWCSRHTLHFFLFFILKKKKVFASHADEWIQHAISEQYAAPLLPHTQTLLLVHIIVWWLMTTRSPFQEKQPAQTWEPTLTQMDRQAHKLYLFCQPSKQTVKISIQYLMFPLLGDNVTQQHYQPWFSLNSATHPSHCSCTALSPGPDTRGKLCAVSSLFSFGVLKRHHKDTNLSKENPKLWPNLRGCCNSEGLVAALARCCLLLAQHPVARAVTLGPAEMHSLLWRPVKLLYGPFCYTGFAEGPYIVRLTLPSGICIPFIFHLSQPLEALSDDKLALQALKVLVPLIQINEKDKGLCYQYETWSAIELCYFYILD